MLHTPLPLSVLLSKTGPVRTAATPLHEYLLIIHPVRVYYIRNKGEQNWRQINHTLVPEGVLHDFWPKSYED